MNRLTPWSTNQFQMRPARSCTYERGNRSDLDADAVCRLEHPTTVSVRHGQGYSRYEGPVSRQLHQTLTVHVPRRTIRCSQIYEPEIWTILGDERAIYQRLFILPNGWPRNSS